MKVVYLERSGRGLIHATAGNFARLFYVPDEDVILVNEEAGTFETGNFSLFKRPELLGEVKAVLDGKSPGVDGVNYSEPKEFDYDDSILTRLIRDAKAKNEIDLNVEFGIKDLIEKVKFQK